MTQRIVKSVEAVQEEGKLKASIKTMVVGMASGMNTAKNSNLIVCRNRWDHAES